MTKFASLESGQSLQLKLGKGPVSKHDPKVPFLDGPTAWVTNTNGMKSQIEYSPSSVLCYLAMPDVAAVEVIDEANKSFTVHIRPVVSMSLEARLAALGDR